MISSARGFGCAGADKKEEPRSLCSLKKLEAPFGKSSTKGIAKSVMGENLESAIDSFFIAMAAVTMLGFGAGKPSEAQQNMTYPSPPDMPDATRGKLGITHRSLLRRDIDGISGQEVIVWDTEYEPRAINPRHYHPAAISFHVISGTGIWQEEGKAPVTLKAGDRLFTPAGTTHSHWNPSHTEKLRFLEFIVGEKDKAQSEPRPPSN